MLERRPQLEQARGGDSPWRGEIDDVVKARIGQRARLHRVFPRRGGGLTPSACLAEQRVGMARAERALGPTTGGAFLQPVGNQDRGYRVGGDQEQYELVMGPVRRRAGD